MIIDKLEKAARFLVSEHKNNQSYKNLPQHLKPSNLDEAYQTQFIFHKLIERGPIGGRKIALVSKIQQEFLGFNQPTGGCLFKNEILYSPSFINKSNYNGLGIEFEIAIILKKDVTKQSKPYNKINVKSYIHSVHSSLELIIDRNANYENIDALCGIADNSWSGGVVVGDEISNWDNLDFNNITSKLIINGNVLEKGSLKEFDIFDSLSWIFNTYTKFNKTIKKEEVIITGSIFKTRFPQKGDEIIYDVGGLSKAKVTIK